jgi:hypothetical protein
VPHLRYAVWCLSSVLVLVFFWMFGSHYFVAKAVAPPNAGVRVIMATMMRPGGVRIATPHRGLAKEIKNRIFTSATVSACNGCGYEAKPWCGSGDCSSDTGGCPPGSCHCPGCTPTGCTVYCPKNTGNQNKQDCNQQGTGACSMCRNDKSIACRSNCGL